MDIIGKKFGRWYVISESVKVGKDKTWLCKCDCGTERSVKGSNLKNGMSKSCGCLQSEMTTNRNKTHGLTKTKTYCAWNNMIRRCETSTTRGFDRYGAQGITVCESWHKFDNFLADMGEAPVGLTIDRIDGSKGYYKENCRWATATTQARNRSFNGTRSGVKGVTLCRNKFRVLIGVNYKQLHIGYFDSIEEAKAARDAAEAKYWTCS